MVVVGGGRRRGAGVRWGAGGVGWAGRRVGGGHEGEDRVEADGAEEGEAVDVAELDFAAEEKKGAELDREQLVYDRIRGQRMGKYQEEKEDGTGQVGVVH